MVISETLSSCNDVFGRDWPQISIARRIDDSRRQFASPDAIACYSRKYLSWLHFDACSRARLYPSGSSRSPSSPSALPFANTPNIPLDLGAAHAILNMFKEQVQIPGGRVVKGVIALRSLRAFACTQRRAPA
jgi:hypothetical protein